MQDSDLDTKLRRLVYLYDKIDEVDAERKKLNEEYDDLSWRIATYMDQSGCEGKKLDSRNFIPTKKVYSKVEDKAQLMEWAKATESYELVMAINAAKVNSYTNECLESGNEVPPGVTPGFIKHGITIRKC
jgi:hypothetical protein